MIFRQFVDDDLGCGSYLVGDEHGQIAVVVDPAYAIEPYLDEAARHGLRIVGAVETHTHADHVSGHGRLALEHGCPVYIHEAAGAEYAHEALQDGSVVDVGSVRIRTIHTPGHRPEHCAFAIVDRSRADEPWLVLSGDSLFVGDVARPDLAVEALEGARGMFRSLRRLTELPDGVELFPGHVAGSLCGAGMSSRVSSTIGFERRFNRALGIDDEDAFVEESVRSTQLRPPNMERIVSINRGPFLGAPPPLARVSEDDARGTTILDVRDVDRFAEGHVHGALNVPVDASSFATRSAFILDPDERVVIHAASVGEADRAARGLRSVGLLELVGYALASRGDERLSPIELDEVERLLDAGAVDVLDVREQDERDEGHVAGTRHVPFRLLRAQADGLGAKPVVTICNSGARAGIAASILAARGVDARPVLHAGVGEWQRRGDRAAG